MVKVNFNDVDNGFDPLPEDSYKLRCTDAELGTSKKNNPKISATFEVIEGKYKGRKVWNDFSLVPNALFDLKAFLEAAGEDVDGEFEGDELVSAIKGSEVGAYLQIRSYKGNKSNSIRTNSWADVNVDLDGNGTLFE